MCQARLVLWQVVLSRKWAVHTVVCESLSVGDYKRLRVWDVWLKQWRSLMAQQKLDDGRPPTFGSLIRKHWDEWMNFFTLDSNACVGVICEYHCSHLLYVEQSPDNVNSPSMQMRNSYYGAGRDEGNDSLCHPAWCKVLLDLNSELEYTCGHITLLNHKRQQLNVD